MKPARPDRPVAVRLLATIAESSPPEISAMTRRCGSTNAATVLSTISTSPSGRSSHPPRVRQKDDGVHTATEASTSEIREIVPGLTAFSPDSASRSPSSSGAAAISPSTVQSMASSGGRSGSTSQGGSWAASTAPPWRHQTQSMVPVGSRRRTRRPASSRQARMYRPQPAPTTARASAAGRSSRATRFATGTAPRQSPIRKCRRPT